MQIYITAFMPVTLQAVVVVLPAVPPVGSIIVMSKFKSSAPDNCVKTEYRVSKVRFLPYEGENQQVDIFLELP